MAPYDVLEFDVAQQDADLRLDVYLAGHIPDCTRSVAALLIRQGNVWVDDAATKPSHKVKPLERITIHMPAPEPVELIPEPMALDFLFEDRHILVVNKPANLVVHPAAGHASGTLVNGILHHCPHLEGIGGEKRPGIVHRLDKDTSGVMVVAKTAKAQTALADQFKSRRVQKRYLALVYGFPKKNSGIVDFAIGRHPVDRKKMSIVSRSSKEAVTHWRVKERLASTALLDIDLKTGRTHQIRVHCQALGYPIVGDPVYGPRRLLGRLARENPTLYQVVKSAARQMLHARRLAFDHPESGQSLTFEAPLPEDMLSIISSLRRLN